MVYLFLVAVLVLLYVLAWSLAVTRLAWRTWRATGRFGAHCAVSAAVSLTLAGALAWVARRFFDLASGLS